MYRSLQEMRQFEKRAYDKWASYGQAKTANVLFALEFDRRFAPRGVRAFSNHPGGIMTELGRHLTPEDIEFIRNRATQRSANTGGMLGPMLFRLRSTR